MQLQKLRKIVRLFLPTLRNLFNFPSNLIRNNKVKFNSVISSNVQMNHTIVREYSYIGQFGVYNAVDIGKYTSIAPFVTIGGAEHSYWWFSTSHFISEKNIGGKITRIGNDVWIGSHVVIRQGVTIGDGAVIGAGSVVLKDVQPFSIVAGSPAKLIKMRFEEKTINKIINLNYWDYKPKFARTIIEKNLINE